MKNNRLTALLLTLLLAAPALWSTPEEAQALAAEAKTALAAGETKTAVTQYEAAIKADPTSASLQTDYAMALVKRMDEVSFMGQALLAGKMLQAYKHSVELDPNHLTGWIGLCRYYLSAPPIAGGSVDKAEGYAQEVAKRVPWLGEMELGLVAEKRGNLDAAADHFRTVLATHPDHGEAVAALARVTQPTAAQPTAAQP